MLRIGMQLLAPFAISVMVATPAWAGWKYIPAAQVSNVDGLTVIPQTEWNQASARPGKTGRSWTQDGFGLNVLEIFAGIDEGMPIYRERSRKRNPMPKFQSGMLLPDLADFFERSFRAQYQVTDFEVLETVPAQFAGSNGLRVMYRYTLPDDELTRLGEVRMAIVGGELFLMNFNAPRLHYFASGIAEVEVMMEGARPN